MILAISRLRVCDVVAVMLMIRMVALLLTMEKVDVQVADRFFATSLIFVNAVEHPMAMLFVMDLAVVNVLVTVIKGDLPTILLTLNDVVAVMAIVFRTALSADTVVEDVAVMETLLATSLITVSVRVEVIAIVLVIALETANEVVTPILMTFGKTFKPPAAIVVVVVAMIPMILFTSLD